MFSIAEQPFGPKLAYNWAEMKNQHLYGYKLAQILADVDKPHLRLYTDGTVWERLTTTYDVTSTLVYVGNIVRGRFVPPQGELTLSVPE